jgi:hypothetical protein
MAKKFGGQIFEQPSSNPFSSLMVFVFVILGVWVLYRAFLKKCCPCESTTKLATPVAPPATTTPPAPTSSTESTVKTATSSAGTSSVPSPVSKSTGTATK